MANNILIGVCDLESVKENMSTWSINKIGGQPDWMYDKVNVECSVCCKSLFLICQLYCPLEQSPYNRTLYILACVDQLCLGNSKTWTVLRSNCLSEKTEEKHIVKSAFDELNVNDLDWGDDSLDYSGLDVKYIKDSLFDANKDLGLNNLNLDNLNDDLNPVNHRSSFKCYYINVFNEEEIYSAEEMDLQHENELLDKYLSTQGISISYLKNQESNQASFDDQIEIDLGKNISKNFLRFKKSLNRCPNQIVRYNYGGKELLLNEMTPDVPCCNNCGAKRNFELQLMPAIFKYLQFKDSAQSNDLRLDFCNILVYTCSKDCSPDATSNRVYQKEFIHLEYDDTSLHNFERTN